MAILKFLKKEPEMTRYEELQERYSRLHELPPVPEDPYELPEEPLFPRPEPKPEPPEEPGMPRFSLAPAPVKMRVSFVTTDQTLHQMHRLCHKLDTQRSDVIRACLEMALPVFESHPEMFNYFAHLARKDW